MNDSEDGDLLLKSPVEFTPPPVGTNLARELLNGLKRHANRTLLVDAQSGRELTGAEILTRSGAIATGLVRHLALKPNDVVMNLCERDVTEALVALGVLLAGGSLYPALLIDGYKEIEVLCELISPQVIIIGHKFCDYAIRLRDNVPGCRDMKIILVDGPDESQRATSINGTSNNNNVEKLSKLIIYDENNNKIVLDEIYYLNELELTNKYDTKLIELIVNEQIEPTKYVSTYMLTSGSTGRPKVVPSTHEEIVYGLYSMLSASQNPFRSYSSIKNELNNNQQVVEGAKSNQSSYLLPLTSQDLISGDLPLDHGAGINTMFLSLCIGCKFIVMPSFDVNLFWHNVSQYKITFSLSSTSFGYNLFNCLKQLIDNNQTGRYDLSSLKWIGVCGAKMAYGDLVYEVLAHECYSHLQVCQAYGCTENGFVSIGLGLEGRVPKLLESTGYLFPGLTAKIVDYTNPGRTLYNGERGELLVWSNSLFKRYISSDKDEASAGRIFAQCHDDKGVFYRTGDQAHFDPAGRLYLHGRFKDTLVLMGDWKVMPAEMEAILDEHPLIETSVVVGVPDPELPGCHAPRAFVKLISRETALRQLDGHNQREDSKLIINKFLSPTSDTDYLTRHIYDYFAKRTAREKHLRGGIRILSELPRVGLLKKIDRKALLLMD